MCVLPGGRYLSSILMCSRRYITVRRPVHACYLTYMYLGSDTVSAVARSREGRSRGGVCVSIEVLFCSVLFCELEW